MNDITEHIGEFYTVNGWGDLAIETEMRRLIYQKIPVKIIKVCRSGLIYVQEDKNRFHSIPLKNLDIIKEN